MSPINYFPCPVCKEKARVKHAVPFVNKRQLYFGCAGCRHHFQVLCMDGQEPLVVAESPRPGVATRKTLTEEHLGAQLLCPSCGTYGHVRATEHRDGETVRRHECPSHGKYFSCVAADGEITTSRVKPTTRRHAADGSVTHYSRR